MQTKMDKQIQPGDYAITWLIRAGKNSPHHSPVPRRLCLCGGKPACHLRKRPKGFKSASFCSFRSPSTMADAAVIEGRALWQPTPPPCWITKSHGVVEGPRNRWWMKQLTRYNGACFYEAGTSLGQHIGGWSSAKEGRYWVRHAAERAPESSWVFFILKRV